MADDNTSVGKISLEIDLTQDLEKEIGNAANKIATGLQENLSKNKYEMGNVDTTAITETIENIPNGMNTAMERTKAVFESAVQSMKKTMESNPFSQMGKLSAPSAISTTPNVLTTNMPEVFTPKVDTNIIDAEFTEVSEKASNVMKQISAGVEETANNAKSLFSDTNTGIEESAAETINTTESKANSAIASIIARVKSIQVPKFDFSKFQIPKSKLGNTETPVSTDSQRIQLDLLTRQMDAFSARADVARAHVKELEAQIAELSKPTGNSVSDFINTSQIEKLREELKMAEAEEQNFGNKSDAVNIKLANLTDKMEIGAAATNKNTTAVRGKGSALDNTGQKGTLFGNIFNKLTGTMKSGENSTRSSGSAFDKLGLSFGQVGRMMDRMLLRMVIFNTVIQGITNFTTFMGKALMTNDKFSNSLETVKSNLMTAFMPIYNAILPALNSLMSTLATVSSYIASFTSQLFGTSYQSSFKSAQALQSQVGALNQTDKQAKKTANSLGTVASSAKKAANGIAQASSASKKGLAGFDQINKLGSPTEGTPAGDGVVAPITPTANMGPIESATSGWADKIRNLLSGIWTPFKNAWSAEGLNTINSAKYALSGIENLIGSIGRSFYSVWTNGTGTKILDNILKMFQNIFKIIGDIGNIFATAWNRGSIGTQIVQNIANAFNNVLIFLNKVGGSIRTVLASEGPTFANMFMEALKATSGVIENVTQKLGWIWDHGGQHAFEGILKLGMKIGELALNIYTNFVAPFVDWFVNMISPAIAVVLDIVGGLANIFTTAIDIVIGILTSLKKGIDTVKDKIIEFKGAIEAIGIILGAFGLALLAYNASAIIAAASTGAMSLATGIWTTVSGIATGVTTAFGVAVAFLTSPVTLVILAIGALIAIGILLYKNWDTIAAFLKSIWNDIKVGAEIVFTAIVTTIKNAFNGIGTWFSNVFTGAWNGIKGAFSAVGGFFQGVFNTIKSIFTTIGSTIGNAIGGAFKYVVNSIIGFAENTINGFIRAINLAIRLIDMIPGVNIETLTPLSIPKMATGGVIDQPTLAMVGEAGKEAVMPLENNTGWIDNLAGKLNSKGQNSDEVAKLLQVIIDILKSLNMNIDVDGDNLAKVVIKQLNKRTRTTGKTELII